MTIGPATAAPATHVDDGVPAGVTAAYSLRRRLFVWIGAAVVGMTLATAGFSFVISLGELDESQDAQLQQICGLLATFAVVPRAPRFAPANEEDVEAHVVVHGLGVPVDDVDPADDVFLPSTLRPGLQTLVVQGFEWRVMVQRNASGQAFGVAERQTVRDEAAGDSALQAVLPLLALAPVLLLIVHLLLRRGFAPLAGLARNLDDIDGGRQVALGTDRVPTEVLPLVRAINRLLARLGLALAQQRRMVADAAHELRTPVAVTRVQADNLAHAGLDSEGRARLDVLQRGLARTSELIDKLLSLARIQGDAAPIREPFSLDQVVRSAIEETLHLAELRGVDLGCLQLETVELLGDPSLAHALARNAIDNAVRYTPSGGTVDVSVTRADGQAVFTVEDTGPGIPAAQRARVFEPFFRLLGSQQSGSGLGLAIVQSAAQALGGQLRLAERSDGASGLRFTYVQRQP
jgi:signal transduction histidine kinase